MIMMVITTRVFDVVQLGQIGLAIGTLLAVIYSTFLAKMAQLRSDAAKQAAEETKLELKATNKAREEQEARVKADLQSATLVNDRKLAVLHILANSGMAVQKKLVAELSEEIAKLTSDPAHHLRAKTAREVYEDHMRRQSVVDQRESESPATPG